MAPSFRDDSAITAQLATVLMVALLMAIAVIVFILVNLYSKDVEPPSQPMTFAVTQGHPGGILEVSTVPGGTHLDWSQFRVGGTATCTAPTGNVDPGDRITCSAAGQVTVVDTKAGNLVFSWDFS